MKESTKRVIRTSLAVLVSLAAMAPVLVTQAGLDVGKWPWLASILAVAAAITRVMALPQVNDLLVKFGIGMPDGRHELGRAQDSTDGAGGDSGHAVVMVLVLLAASAFVAVLTAGPALAHRRPPIAPATPAAMSCPAGYLLAEVHLGGQRIEAGIDPATHLTVPALVQNSEVTDLRYVVALACIRDLTADERQAQRDGLSTTPLQLPLVLAGDRG